MSINPRVALEQSDFDMREESPNQKKYYQCGLNIVKRLKRYSDSIEPLLITAADHREDSPKLLENLIDGIFKEGGRVLNLGCDIPKPVAYFAAERFNADSVAYVTASHVKFNNNGLKVNSRKVDKQRTQELPRNPRNEILEFYKDYLQNSFGKDMGKGKIIAVSPLYGTSCGLAQEVFENVGYKVISLHDYIERKSKRLYENAPDPHLIENLSNLREICKKLKCFGVAFDGDMDRVCFVDENGEKVQEEEIIMICSKYLIEKLKKEKGPNIEPKVVYDIKSSNAVPELIREFGGEPIMEKTGWQNISKKMLSTQAIFAGEISGHYFTNSYYVPRGDDGLFTALMVGKILSESKKSLIEIRKDFKKFFISPEMRLGYSEERNPEVVNSLEETFRKKGYTIRKIGDDIRIEKYSSKEPNPKSWESWAVVRCSKTEAKKLTIRFEGRTVPDLEKMVDEFIEAIPEQDGDLKKRIRERYEIGIKNGVYGEIVDIIDSRNRVLRRDSLYRAHLDGLRHRSVHVLVVDPKTKKILVAERSRMQPDSPLKCHVSAGGHVHAGETYQEAAIRELKEELFHEIDFPDEIKLQRIGAYKNDTRETNKEIVNLFVAKYYGFVSLDRAEIETTFWKSIKEILKEMKENSCHYSGSFKNAMKKYMEKTRNKKK